ncbi:hypothetical protein JMUB7520_27570 [Staphylococcus aureus]
MYKRQDVLRESLVDVDVLMEPDALVPVSYTHLTLPTTSRV